MANSSGKSKGWPRPKVVEVTLREGGSHTHIAFGEKRTTIPRHHEVNEFTARSILKFLATDHKEEGK